MFGKNLCIQLLDKGNAFKVVTPTILVAIVFLASVIIHVQHVRDSINPQAIKVAVIQPIHRTGN